MFFSQEYFRGKKRREPLKSQVFAGYVSPQVSQGAELCRHALGGQGSLQFSPRADVPGSRPDRGKGQRGHQRQKLVKADMLPRRRHMVAVDTKPSTQILHRGASGHAL